MTVKDLNELSNKIKDISNYILELSENENNTIDDKIELSSINTKINIIESKILFLVKNKLEL